MAEEGFKRKLTANLKDYFTGYLIALHRLMIPALKTIFTLLYKAMSSSSDRLSLKYRCTNADSKGG